MESAGNSDPNMTSQLVLRVALETMNERCKALQGRVNSLEEENQQLRGHTAAAALSADNGGATENFQLRLQVADLNRQKAQLSEHINMVSNENKKLWSRISQMAKDNQNNKCNEKDNCICNNENGEDATVSPRSCGGANQNLIRSKTFTQHSPNPQLLRYKLIDKVRDELHDISLDEVALDAYEDKMVRDTDAEFGFAYLSVEETPATTSVVDVDFSLEEKKCLEGLQALRREAVEQQQQLSAALTALETRIVLQPCPDCTQKNNKPETADKSLETDESLSETKIQDSTYLQSTTTSNVTALHNGHSYSDVGVGHLNIIQEKINADSLDKTCPMCGKIFSIDVSFNSFRTHVEMHFIDDASIENSIDRNFEFISHTVGDF